jgi:hypothetical protein
MDQLPTKEQERIKADSIKTYPIGQSPFQKRHGYIAGATAEAVRAIPLVEALKRAVELTDDLPVDWTGTGSPKEGEKDAKIWAEKWRTEVIVPLSSYTGEQPESSEKSELEQLRQWKREAIEVYAPIHEYAQNHPEARLGVSMVAFVVERALKYDEKQTGEQPAQQPADKKKEALMSILQLRGGAVEEFRRHDYRALYEIYNQIAEIAAQALTGEQPLKSEG